MAIIATIRPNSNSQFNQWRNQSGGTSLFGSIDEASADDDTTYVEFLATGVILFPPPAENPQNSGLGLVNLANTTSVDGDQKVRDTTWKNLKSLDVRDSSWKSPKVLYVMDTTWKLTAAKIVMHVRLKRVVNSGGGTTKFKVALYHDSVLIKTEAFTTVTNTSYFNMTFIINAGDWLGRSIAGLQVGFESEVTPDNAFSTLGIRMTQIYLDFEDA